MEKRIHLSAKGHRSYSYLEIEGEAYIEDRTEGWYKDGGKMVRKEIFDHAERYKLNLDDAYMAKQALQYENCRSGLAKWSELYCWNYQTGGGYTQLAAKQSKKLNRQIARNRVKNIAKIRKDNQTAEAKEQDLQNGRFLGAFDRAIYFDRYYYVKEADGACLTKISEEWSSADTGAAPTGTEHYADYPLTKENAAMIEQALNFPDCRKFLRKWAKEYACFLDGTTEDSKSFDDVNHQLQQRLALNRAKDTKKIRQEKTTVVNNTPEKKPYNRIFSLLNIKNDCNL